VCPGRAPTCQRPADEPSCVGTYSARLLVRGFVSPWSRSTGSPFRPRRPDGQCPSPRRLVVSTPPRALGRRHGFGTALGDYWTRVQNQRRGRGHRPIALASYSPLFGRDGEALAAANEFAAVHLGLPENAGVGGWAEPRGVLDGSGPPRVPVQWRRDEDSDVACRSSSTGTGALSDGHGLRASLPQVGMSQVPGGQASETSFASAAD
jgi:hypothetical protein